MSIRIMSALWEIPLPPTEKLVLLALADAANDDGVCWPSIATVARKSGVSERSVQRSIRMAEKAGLIQREEVIGKGCKYRINPRHSVTPDNVAPVTNATSTPDTVSPKPSGTVSPKKDKPSLGTPARKRDAYPAPEGVTNEVWRDFLASPKRRKAGMSPTAYSGIRNNLVLLAEHGFPPGKMIELAVERGWTTVKLEWVQNDGRNTGNRGSSQRMGGPGPSTTLAILRAANGAIARNAEGGGGARPALPASEHGG